MSVVGLKMASKPTDHGKRGYQKHRLYSAKRVLREYGSRAIDKRTKAGKAIAQWIDDVIDDLGGEETITTAQRTIVERAAVKRLLVHGVESYLAEQGPRAVINKRDRKLHRVVSDYLKLSESLTRDLTTLGLERRKPPAEDLTSYLERQNYGDTDR